MNETVETHVDGTLQALHDEAFARFGARGLWNTKPSVTPDGLRYIAERLRKHGDMAAWRLADRILARVDHADR